MSSWTFITNHGAVRAIIAKHGRIKAADIAIELGITERSVRRIIADLVVAGYVEAKREKGINRYWLNSGLSLRRPEMQDLKVEELLRCLSVGKRKRRSQKSTEV